MSINEIFKSLTPLQQGELMVAFEACNGRLIEYSPGKFIGVFVYETSEIVITESEGYFSIGDIRKCA